MFKKMIAFLLVISAMGAAQDIVFRNDQVRLVPKILNYQGYLTDTLGNPITGPSVSMAFAIFDAVSGGSQKWTENQTVAVAKGIFNVLLGTVATIPDSVFTGGIDRWLQLTVGGQVLLPRTRITAVGYAYASTFSDTAEFARNAVNDNDWVRIGADSVLYTAGRLGIARGGVGNILFGDSAFTHTNFGGYACTTGIDGSSISYVTMCGGYGNRADSLLSTVVGGYYNKAIGAFSFIGAGGDNSAIGTASFIGGGGANKISGRNGVIGGGHMNTVDETFGVIGGGRFNKVGGFCSSILGGYADTIASGADYSYLFGINGDLTQDSTFMVDMPHIRFGSEISGYEFPHDDGFSGQAMVTDGSGQVSWSFVTSDSARVAGNSHRLEGHEISGLDSLYVNEGQVNSISSAMINDLAVSNGKLQFNSVTTDRIKDSTISGLDISVPCSLYASRAFPSGALHLRNDQNGYGMKIDSAGGDGIYIYGAGGSGCYVWRTGLDGIYVANAGDDGIHIARASNKGVRINRASDNAIYIDSSGNHAINIDSSGGNSVNVFYSGSHGLRVYRALGNGMDIDSIGGHGFYVRKATTYGGWINQSYTGLYLNRTQSHALRIDSAGGNGIGIGRAFGAGVKIQRTMYGNGFSIDTAATTAFRVDSTGGCGLRIARADSDGVRIGSAKKGGLYIGRAGDYGITIGDTRLWGIWIDSTADDGVHVEKALKSGIVAIGNDAGGSFTASSESGEGLYVSSYNGNAADTAIRAYGECFATGGWFTSFENDRAASCIVSAERALIVSGTVHLDSDEALVKFEPLFTENIRADLPVRITATPRGRPTGLLYVAQSDESGFRVAIQKIPGLEGGDNGMIVDWIAYGTLKDPETSEQATAEWRQIAGRKRDARQ